MSKISKVLIIFCISFLSNLCFQADAQQTDLAAQDKARLDAVIKFADNLLKDGKDVYSGKATPLLVNGINVFTKEPVKWIFSDGNEAVLSDFACQQNLMRVLVSLSNLTGDEKYKSAAKNILQYMFEHFQDTSGLLQWGGHKFIDLKSLNAVGPSDKELVHELKNAYPYYDFWYEVNPEATVKFIKAFWNAHVYNWKTLEISRHGKYGLIPGDIWNHTFEQQIPFFKTRGLSFLDAGNDLIYSGVKLYEFTQDTGALLWAKRLASQYVLSRDPKTGLGAYQFTQPRKTAEPPADSSTFSQYGDRVQRQFGPEFGPNALEGTILLKKHIETIYSINAMMEIQLANDLGKDGEDFYKWTKEGMSSLARYSYIPDKNLLRPMFNDGQDLSDFVLKRDGYNGRKGTVLRQIHAGNMLLISFARASMLTQDKSLWDMARSIAKGNGLGDIGTEPAKNIKLNYQTKNDDAYSVFALVDIFRQTQNSEYLNLARVVANNLVKNKFNHGYFTPGADYLYANFDAIEPYALLTLEAAIKGTPDKVPGFINGAGFVQGEYKFPDGSVKSIKDDYFYKLQKGNLQPVTDTELKDE
jgi:pectate lyase